MNYYCQLSLLFMIFCKDVFAAVRMMEPLQRSSLWRRGEPGAERNVLDGDLNCGGYEEQWKRQGGCCGICGDPCDSDKPNEHGGIYAKNIISANYNQGDTIEVQITRNNVQTLGYFEFRICEAPEQSEVSRECLDRNLLPIIDSNNNTRFYPGTGGQTFRLSIVLPQHLFCSRCVLQFKYNTGYRLPDTAGACDCLGCGHQEQYYNCADISITKDPNYVPPSTSTVSTINVSSNSASSSVKSTSSTPELSIITIFPSPSVITVTRFESPTICIEPTFEVTPPVLSVSPTPTSTPGSFESIFTRVTTEVVTTTIFQTPTYLDTASKHCMDSTRQLSSVTSLPDLKPSSTSLKISQDSLTPTRPSSNIDFTSRSACLCPSNMETVTVSSACPPASTVLAECSNTIDIRPSCPEVSTISQTSKPWYVTPPTSESSSKESNELIWPWPDYYRKYHMIKKNDMSPQTKYHTTTLRQFKKRQYYIISGRSKYNPNQIIHSPSNEKPQATENTTSDRFFNKLFSMVKNLTSHNYTVFDKEVNNALKSECPTSTVFVTVTKHIQPSTTVLHQASSSIIHNQEAPTKDFTSGSNQISPTPVIKDSPPVQRQETTTTKPTQCLPRSPNYRCFSVYKSVTDDWCRMNCPDKFCPYYLCLCACTDLQALPTTPKPTKVCRSIRAGITDQYCAEMCTGSYCPRGYCECVRSV